MTMLELECWRASSNQVVKWLNVSLLNIEENLITIFKVFPLVVYNELYTFHKVTIFSHIHLCNEKQISSTISEN